MSGCEGQHGQTFLTCRSFRFSLVTSSSCLFFHFSFNLDNEVMLFTLFSRFIIAFIKQQGKNAQSEDFFEDLLSLDF